MEERLLDILKNPPELWTDEDKRLIDDQHKKGRRAYVKQLMVQANEDNA